MYASAITFIEWTYVAYICVYVFFIILFFFIFWIRQRFVRSSPSRYFLLNCHLCACGGAIFLWNSSRNVFLSVSAWTAFTECAKRVCLLRVCKEYNLRIAQRGWQICGLQCSSIGTQNGTLVQRNHTE